MTAGSRKRRGFTLVDLVVVILLLAILAATFLPRFTDTSEQTFAAKMTSLRGTLSSAISLYHAAWQVAQVDGAQVNLSTFGLGELDANAFGYPVSGAAISRSRVETWTAKTSGGVCSTPHRLWRKPTIFYDTQTGVVLLDLDRVF